MVYRINGVPNDAKAVKYPKPRSGTSVRVTTQAIEPPSRVAKIALPMEK